MNLLDFLILPVLLGGFVSGYSTGLIRQVASLLGMILAFVLGVHLMEPVGAMVSGSLGLSERVAPLVGFVLVFLGIQVVVFALAKMVEALVGALKLTLVNRLLGGGLGVVKSALLLSVTFLVLQYVQLPGASLREGSWLYEPVASSLPRAWAYLSDNVPQVESLSEKFGGYLPGAHDDP